MAQAPSPAVPPLEAATKSPDTTPTSTAPAATATQGFAWPSAPISGLKSPFSAAPKPAPVASQAPTAAPAPLSPAVPEMKPANLFPSRISASPAATQPPLAQAPVAQGSASVSEAATPELGFNWSSMGLGATPAGSSAPAATAAAESPFAKGLNLGMPQTASNTPFGGLSGLTAAANTSSGSGSSSFFTSQPMAPPAQTAFPALSGLGTGGGFGTSQIGGQTTMSPFGVASNQASGSMLGGSGAAFGQPARPMGPVAGFGQPSVMGAMPGFGQAASPGMASPSSAGGGASGGGTAFAAFARAPASPFAQVAGQQSGFGAAAAAAAAAAASSSPFAAVAQQQSPFAAAAQQPQASGFGFHGQQQMGGFGASPTQGVGFGAQQQQPGAGFGAASPQQRDSSAFSQMRR